jgi:hypothetical protein
MAMVEGIGLVPPHRVRVPLSDEDRSLVRTLTRQRLEQRKYELRTDVWGPGLIGAWRSVESGWACEVAFRNWAWLTCGVWLELDTKFKLYGDGGIDFRLGGYGIQVKGATTEYDELLVKTCDAQPGIATWDIIVRAHWPARSARVNCGGIGLFDNRGDRPLRDHGVAELCGWAWQHEFMRHAVICPARRGEHNNYELHPRRFHAMDDLAMVAAARGGLVGGLR